MTTVILTRPVPAIQCAKEVYQKAGFTVFEAPVFDIKTNPSVKPQWLGLAADVWIILSVNALNHALKINPDLKPEKNTHVIAVGPAVKKAWSQQFDHPISHHPLMNSEGVVELMQEKKPKSVKILTTDGGRELIKTHCMRNSISYIQINCYIRVPLTIDLDGLRQLYKNNNDIILCATSSDILTEFTQQLPNDLLSQILATQLIVGAKRIAELAQEFGFSDIHLAASPKDEAMSVAVTECVD